jgi:hypothetical protein
MKKYKAWIGLILEAENIDDALNEVHNCLMLGVLPESVDIQQIAEIPERTTFKDILKDDCLIKGLKRD